MKSISLRLLCVLLITSSFAKAQGNGELSFGAGVASYYGDLMESNHAFFSQPNYAFTLGGQYYFSPKWSIRGDFSVLKVGAADSKNKRADLKARNLSFKSGIWELSAEGQYDILDIQSGERQFTPYLFGGFGIFHFNPYTTDRNGNKVYLQTMGTEGQGLSAYPDRKPYKKTQLNLPFGIGVKYVLNDRMVVGLEFKYRYIDTDYLDDVSTDKYPDYNVLYAKNPNLPGLTYRGDELPGGSTYPKNSVLPRGNPNNNDSYYSVQAKLIWRLNSSKIQINY